MITMLLATYCAQTKPGRRKTEIGGGGGEGGISAIFRRLQEDFRRRKRATKKERKGKEDTRKRPELVGVWSRPQRRITFGEMSRRGEGDGGGEKEDRGRLGGPPKTKKFSWAVRPYWGKRKKLPGKKGREGNGGVSCPHQVLHARPKNYEPPNMEEETAGRNFGKRRGRGRWEERHSLEAF